MKKEKTKEQDIREITYRLWNEATKQMKANLNKVLKSGCIDIESHEIGSYDLPKILVCALSTDIKAAYMPRSEEARKEFENICLFI